MVKRVLAALLLPLLLAGASPVETEAPVPRDPVWVERHFDAGADALQAALAVAMKQQRLSLDPDAVAQPDEVVTVWRRFEPRDFGPSVAHDTPTIGSQYPYASPSRLRQGSYRLRARVLCRGDGTVLMLQAELLADAYNFVEFEEEQVERFSNGVIEDAVFAQVQQALRRRSKRD